MGTSFLSRINISRDSIFEQMWRLRQRQLLIQMWLRQPQLLPQPWLSQGRFYIKTSQALLPRYLGRIKYGCIICQCCCCISSVVLVVLTRLVGFIALISSVIVESVILSQLPSTSPLDSCISFAGCIVRNGRGYGVCFQIYICKSYVDFLKGFMADLQNQGDPPSIFFL